MIFQTDPKNVNLIAVLRESRGVFFDLKHGNKQKEHHKLACWQLTSDEDDLIKD